MVVEASSPAGGIVTYTATASDIVDVSVAVTCSTVSGSSLALGTLTVSCSATDAAGNTATGSFEINVGE